jgi:hypothetical protein
MRAVGAPAARLPAVRSVDNVGMTQIPDTIVLKRDRDLVGRQSEVWVRRGLFALLCVVPVLALLNVFGQRPAGSGASVGAAHLEVNSTDGRGIVSGR